jgi:tetratricopeptide (TPR) repeat protein
MKIGVYALAKDEARHAAAWAAATVAADVRVVTDTGSSDDTRESLRAAGVTVAESAIVPWRWDVAWTQALCNLPADLDVAFRVDLDERPQPGWREAIEAAWDGTANNLVYDYWWSMKPDGSPLLRFYCDRVHARSGFVWRQATHEGLCCWSGEKRQKLADGLVVEHHRDPGKVHKTDLTLLRVAVRESPADARARWYLAREMDYAGMPTAAAEFASYLRMPGGTPTERSYAFRRLASITGDLRHLERAAKEAPGEPDAWERLALAAHHQGRWEESATFAEQAIAAPIATHATEPMAKARARELASIALWQLGRQADALTHAKAAADDMPWDERVVANAAAMEASL